jgi:hypothetical protein
VPRQRIADERNALEMSKYGSEPAPQTWDIGQELEGEQTFLRRGLGTDVLTGLRRGRWVVQGRYRSAWHDDGRVALTRSPISSSRRARAGCAACA